MKRILYITVRADYGGGPEHVFTLLKSLKNHYELFIACPKEPPYWELYKSILGSDRMIELPHRQFSIKKFIKLFFIVRSSGINIVHSHGKGAGVYSRLLKIFLPTIKVVHTFHGIHFDQKSCLPRMIHLAVERFLACCTDYFINVSEGELIDGLRLGICSKKKSIVIYNGIDIPCLNESPPLIDELDINDFIVLHITRFDCVKNSGLVLKIAGEIDKLGSQITFIIIGDGPERIDLEKVAQEKGLKNIHFLGFQLQAVRYLKYASAYLSTSLKEGLPLTLVESMAMGVPVIATDVTGNNEIVVHGENGFLYPDGSLDLAIKYIQDLKSNPSLLKLLGENARKTYLDKFRKEI
ncbi:MAG: Glycosyltransferase, partial [Parcubacteria bacterium 33_209]